MFLPQVSGYLFAINGSEDTINKTEETILNISKQGKAQMSARNLKMDSHHHASWDDVHITTEDIRVKAAESNVSDSSTVSTPALQRDSYPASVVGRVDFDLHTTLHVMCVWWLVGVFECYMLWGFSDSLISHLYASEASSPVWPVWCVDICLHFIGTPPGMRVL